MFFIPYIPLTISSCVASSFVNSTVKQLKKVLYPFIESYELFKSLNNIVYNLLYLLKMDVILFTCWLYQRIYI